MVDLPGKPTFGEVSEEWVFDFVRAIFGAYDAKNATRLINEFFLLISKKNGKSTIVAGIMVTALIRNWRYSAELLILAPTLEVAKNAYTPAADMVREDPELRDLLHPQDVLRQIKHRVTGAVLKVVAADTDSVGGKKAAFVMVEELWLFGKRPKSAAMLMEATGGLVSRAEGFVIYISTQSDEPPAGVFKEKLELFRDIRDGKIIDPKKLGVLYEYPEKMIEDERYLEPEFFYVTNPNLGKSVSAEWLIGKLAESQRGDKGILNVFLAKHLNVEIGMRLRTDRWRGADHWVKATEKELTLESLIERSEVITMGGDGGGLDDLLGLAIEGREKGTRRRLLWNKAWCYVGVLELRKEIAPRLLDFKKLGQLGIVDVLGDDMAEVTAIARQVVESGKLAEKDAVGLDPAGVGGLVEAFELAGVTKDQIVGVSQGWRLSGAIVSVERGLADGTLRHAGMEIMAWCVGNAKIELRGQSKLITKSASGTGKIDPLLASFNADSLMSQNPPAQDGRSIYDRAGIWETANAAG